MIDVLSWIWIAVATYGCGLALGRLTIGRTKPEMTEPGARGRAWYLCSFLTSIALAVLLLTGGWQPGRWLVTIAFVVILVSLRIVPTGGASVNGHDPLTGGAADSPPCTSAGLQGWSALPGPSCALFGPMLAVTTATMTAPT